VNYQWTYKNVDENQVKTLHQELKIHPVLCQLLVQRNVRTFNEAKDFFRADLSALHNPYLMKNMDKAVARIETAIQQKQKILIYGDYDVDGTTSVALCYLFFSQFYKNLEFYVPDRHTEGYGISMQGIDYAADNNFALVIALDCGIKAVEKIAYANEKNIDFIICDHHTPGAIIPDAVAILNPKQKDCTYPYDELSGCGIGFKLCQAYANKNNIKQEALFQFLDLVCISIACDIVPITDENRILAKYGLEKLNTNPSLGVANIVELLQLNKAFTIADVVFKIGPRINAAGRIAHAKTAVEVLIGKTDVSVLQDKNTERQELDKETTECALAFLEKENNKNLVTNVVFDASWHKGVVGIVASRIIETHYKPTVVLCESNGKLTGSVRSVQGFNVYEPLDACSDLFTNFGGHAYAAGLTLEKENLEAFKVKFNEEVAKRITSEQLIPKINIDATITLADINPSFFNIMQQFAPFGPQNMRPVFVAKNLMDAGYTRIVGENHLKLNLKDQQGNRINGIAFRMADKLPLIKNDTVDVCFVIEENHWNGKTTLEMNVRDIKQSK